MGRIYGISTLTIVAAVGDGPHHGLPGVGSPSRQAQPELRLDRYCLAVIQRAAVEAAASKSPVVF